MEASEGRVKALLRRIGPAFWPPLVFLVFLVALWELASTQGWVSELILPRPGEVATSFVELLAEGLIWGDLWATTYETLAGFVVAGALGIVLAIVCGLWDLPRRMLYPYIITLQVTPRIAIAPILIAGLGFGYTPKIVLAATIAFFPIFINALTGMVSVDADAREMFRSLGASRRQTFTHLMLPNSLPITFAGLKIGMTLALIGAVVGEFISADEGLGLLVQRFSSALNMADALAVVLILTLLGLVLYAAMEYLDRALVFWSHDSRLVARSRRRAARAARRDASPERRGQAFQHIVERRVALADRRRDREYERGE